MPGGGGTATVTFINVLQSQIRLASRDRPTLKALAAAQNTRAIPPDYAPHQETFSGYQ